VFQKNPIPDDWKTDNLIVLVGGNSLPNYVAGKALLRKDGLLHLIHSVATQDVAKRIGDQFGVEGEKWHGHTLGDPASRTDVEDALHNALKQCSGKSVGLNYTGGTKAMSVHAFEGIRKQDARPDAVITYLDARTLTMRRVDDHASTHRAEVQMAVQPTLGTLLDLHNISIKENDLQTETREEIFNQKMAEAYADPAVATAYEAWCQRYLRNFRRIKTSAGDALLEALKKLNEEGDHEKKIAVLGMEVRAISEIHQTERAESAGKFPQKPMIPFPDDPILASVADAMREMMGVDGDSFDPLAVAQSGRTDFTRYKDIIRHLDGEWVEHLTMRAFCNLEQSYALHGICMTVDTDSASTYNFEFDVVAMQGYQLHAVSCTRTARMDLCKSKLFEARLRASQLGGDEARVALVCAHPEPGKLRDQVRRWWQQGDAQFQVYGARDLAHLSDRFAKWLTERNPA
jgi:hypothetical protein